MSGIPASVQQPANTITAIKTFMVTFLQCSFSASSSSRLMHSTGAAFNISIALTNIRIHAVPTVNLYFLADVVHIIQAAVHIQKPYVLIVNHRLISYKYKI